jgi:hypothetical protein
MTWNETTVGMIYGIDANAAAALRVLVRDAVYGDFVPNTLLPSFGSDGAYKTQTVNQWLFGWFDPVSQMVANDPTAPDAGWTKLETNQTYYGSGGVSTGPATTYTICTGHNSDCDKGETLLEDGSNELPWHNTNMMMATFGLVGVETLDETTGGFLTGDGDKSMLVAMRLPQLPVKEAAKSKIYQSIPVLQVLTQQPDQSLPS